ncbi:MAG: hypothetical protein AB1488_07000 [Nitrospirota bacterium]
MNKNYDRFLESEHEEKEKFGMTRRDFIRTAVVTGLATVTPILMEPVPYKRGAYAAEKKIPAEYWEIASKYGEPRGEFGRVGDPVKITVGFQPYCVHHWCADINKQAKLWEKYLPKGSKVEWFRSLSGPLINNNMLAGKNMVGYMGDTPGLRTMDTVPCVNVNVGGYGTGEMSALMIRKDIWDNGKVKSPKDVDGWKVATPLGSGQHRHSLDIADEFNIKITLIDQSTELQVTHMRAKNIDACVTWDPYCVYLEHLKLANRFITGLEMKCTCGKFYPVKVPHNWTTTSATLMIVPWLRDRPDIMVGYLKAEEEARDMWNNDVDLAAYYCWSDIPEFPQSVVRMSMDMQVPDGRLTENAREHIKGLAYCWRSVKILTTEKSKDPSKFVDEWVDDRFAKLAIKELKAMGRWTSDKLPGFPIMPRKDHKSKHRLEDYAKVTLKPKKWKPTKVKW